MTYFEDGNLIQDSTGITGLAAAASRSTAHGTWKRTGHNQFTHTFVYFRFDEERRYIGTRVVTSTMTLSEDGSQYQGDPVAQNFDTEGNLLSTVRGGIDSGQRLF